MLGPCRKVKTNGALSARLAEKTSQIHLLRDRDYWFAGSRAGADTPGSGTGEPARRAAQASTVPVNQTELLSKVSDSECKGVGDAGVRPGIIRAGPPASKPLT